MVLILASTNVLSAMIAAGCFIAALLIVLCLAKNWTLRGLCIGFIIFIGGIWALQIQTEVRMLRYVILFIGVMNSLFSVYDIYDDLISRRVNSSDAEKFAELCPCCCAGPFWGVLWLGNDIFCFSFWSYVPWPCPFILSISSIIRCYIQFCLVLNPLIPVPEPLQTFVSRGSIRQHVASKIGVVQSSKFKKKSLCEKFFKKLGRNILYC
ncbi:hypothetical protein MTR67_010232 [Solanum verrucosum]|uniref:Uncharacterized protein n=1 Tax=Solanum verrucosum TaxID=315347 RepID=A0AAF0Q5T6_SOLVR|nr:hypothetical protein MTR67_010232 [Solanum verrucosum]